MKYLGSVSAILDKAHERVMRDLERVFDELGMPDAANYGTIINATGDNLRYLTKWGPNKHRLVFVFGESASHQQYGSCVMLRLIAHRGEGRDPTTATLYTQNGSVWYIDPPARPEDIHQYNANYWQRSLTVSRGSLVLHGDKPVVASDSQKFPSPHIKRFIELFLWAPS